MAGSAHSQYLKSHTQWVGNPLTKNNPIAEFLLQEGEFWAQCQASQLGVGGVWQWEEQHLAESPEGLIDPPQDWKTSSILEDARSVLYAPGPPQEPWHEAWADLHAGLGRSPGKEGVCCWLTLAAESMGNTH